MNNKPTVKVLKLVPSKKVTLNMACSTCKHHKVDMIDIDKGIDVCDVYEAHAEVSEPAKWRCDQWILDEEATMTLN